MTKIGLFWNYLSLLHISEGRLFLVNSSGKKEQCTKEKMKHCVLLLPPFSDFLSFFSLRCTTGWAQYNIWNTSRFITYRALKRRNAIFDLETIATECCSYSLLAKAHQEYNQNRQKPIKIHPHLPTATLLSHMAPLQGRIATCPYCHHTHLLILTWVTSSIKNIFICFKAVKFEISTKLLKISIPIEIFHLENWKFWNQTGHGEGKFLGSTPNFSDLHKDQCNFLSLTLFTSLTPHWRLILPPDPAAHTCSNSVALLERARRQQQSEKHFLISYRVLKRPGCAKKASWIFLFLYPWDR